MASTDGKMALLIESSAIESHSVDLRELREDKVVDRGAWQPDFEVEERNTGIPCCSGTTCNGARCVPACAAERKLCNETHPCCVGSRCVGDLCHACVGLQVTCAGDGDCCRGACGNGVCLCASNGASCAASSDCCNGTCANGLCTCAPRNLRCTANEDCCDGSCTDGTCGCSLASKGCSSMDDCCKRDGYRQDGDLCARAASAGPVAAQTASPAPPTATVARRAARLPTHLSSWAGALHQAESTPMHVPSRCLAQRPASGRGTRTATGRRRRRRRW